MKFNTALIVAGAILLNIAGSLCQLEVCGQAPLNNKIFGGEDATAGCCGNYSASGVVMYFGRQSQSGLNPKETYRGARQIIIHANYNNPVHDNDIALVQLSSSVTFSDYISPVCLAAAGSTFAAGTKSWITGWGKLHSGDTEISDILQEVQVPIVSNSDCYTAYGGLITSNMICAGIINVGEKGPCQGDSGGPVVSRNGSLWIQSGIVSFGGVKCDDPKYPSVFTRVSRYQDWITSKIGSNPPGFVGFNNSGFRSSLNLLLFTISLMFSIIPFTFSFYLSS
ncbi:Transmembrane protease serine 11C [Labeo rohita]|uniref:Transmembrane protease serine 11C n=1 Tax=Labeo rohita TaxID=84645 RepID=A0ABQ8L9P3_LABRO|nr:Transmembrane protease serine 11C [Labeo rohita]